LKKILVIGKSGQLAWELQQLSRPTVDIQCLGRNDIDLLNQESIEKVVSQLCPDTIINTSAYTAVDLAETEKEQAYQLNSHAVTNLAQVCKKLDLSMVHVSTDFVFDGQKASPYLVNDLTQPLGVYGASKLQGEEQLIEILGTKSCIIRTSWLYSTHGNNFVKTMLRLMSEKESLGIISDQVGSPTYAKGLAEACLYAANHEVPGVHHWTDLGVASWYDFAVAIQEEAVSLKLLDYSIPINPIRTEDYPTAATRPNFSVLDKSTLSTHFSDLSLTHWRKNLRNMLSQLK
jgi:dTDP-4-dehydrorhamnose reductase